MGEEIFKQPSIGGVPFGRGMIIDQEGKVVKAFFGHQPQMVIETIYSLLENGTSTSSLEVKDGSNLIQVYPNPVSENCNISFDKNYDEINIELYTIDGRKILQKSASNLSRLTLDINEIPKGLYLMNISLDNKYFSIKKILKK